MPYLYGCYYYVASLQNHFRMAKHYLPLLSSEAHTTILLTSSSTSLKQTFTNPSSRGDIKECIHTFPLYDGVSIVSFTHKVGSKTLNGLVMEKVKAKRILYAALAKGETTGFLEQATQASDIFSMKFGGCINSDTSFRAEMYSTQHWSKAWQAGHTWLQFWMIIREDYELNEHYLGKENSGKL